MYDRLLAAHLIQLGPQILTKIQQINDSNCGKRIPKGRIKAKLMAVDGSDGFGDLHIISSKESRDYSEHGITADFTVIRVLVEHQLEEVRVEGAGDVVVGGGDVVLEEGEQDDEEFFLSQALSQSTIAGDSCITATQSTVDTSMDGSIAEDNIDHHIVIEDGYSLVFEEPNPNSSLVSRPVFRGKIYEKQNYVLIAPILRPNVGLFTYYVREP